MYLILNVEIRFIWFYINWFGYIVNMKVWMNSKKVSLYSDERTKKDFP